MEKTMSSNMQFYDELAFPPKDAVSGITGGKLEGFSSVNTQWRIERLTEVFGPYGKGWYLDNVYTNIDCTDFSSESKATVALDLFVKYPGQEDFCMPAHGVGGAPRVSMFSKKIKFSDECYKSAYSDAISYAAKMFGLAGSVYTDEFNLSNKMYQNGRSPEAMRNLKTYMALANPEPRFVKKISGGDLKGLSSITPQWRSKKMTETFGPYGIGWYIANVKQWIEDDPLTKESKAYVELDLYVKYPGDSEFSKPAHGIGGAPRVSQFSTGTDFSDECFKCAYTDAFSCAGRFFGLGSAVYRNQFDGKYDKDRPEGRSESIDGTDARPVDMTGSMTPNADVSSMRRRVPGSMTEEQEAFLKEYNILTPEGIAWIAKTYKMNEKDVLTHLTEKQAQGIIDYKKKKMMNPTVKQDSTAKQEVKA